MEENENNSAVTRAGLPLKKDVLIRAGFPLKGGEGSGNFGHEGRPGEVGGAGGGGGDSTTTYAETESKPSTDLQPMLEATMPDTRPYKGCLLYTSDAADDLLCVDLGGRRII